MTPAQYAYGGGSNGAAVIASRPSTPGGGAGAGSGAGTVGVGPGPGSAGAPGGAAEPTPGAAGQGKGGPGTNGPQALVGVAAARATPVATFGALNRAIPTDALWAAALAVACALGAWLLRRGRGSAG